MYAKTRPSIRPSIFTPRHAPLHHRPSHSLKNVGISQNSCESLKFMSHQRLSAPPRAPPCFMVVKFKIRAQTFHIIIFHENAFLLMYRPNRLFEIRSFTMTVLRVLYYFGVQSVHEQIIEQIKVFSTCSLNRSQNSV